MKKALNFDREKPVSKVGWSPTFEVPDAGWTTKLITDDPTLVVRAVRKTRDQNGNWKTYYLQVTSPRETRRLRRKLAKVIDRDRKEERETRKLRLLLRIL